MTTSVLVCAGEVSGDRLAAPVVRCLRGRQPELRFFGVGGDALAGAGVELSGHVDGLAVTGLSEVLPRLGAVAGALSRLAWQLIARRPALALLVDYPGLNLQLARLLRQRGVPVLQLVAPQRWAWMPWRARRLPAKVDQLAVTLPFERAWFAAHGVAVEYVGHPLVDGFARSSRQEARRVLGLAERERVVALLPGSRAHEVARHLPVMLDAVARLEGARPLLAVVEGAPARACRALGPPSLMTTSEHALAAADLAICASGTATLECALADVPAVVLYRTSRLSFAVGNQLLNVSMLALPNLILGRRLLPELLQDDVTPEGLAGALVALGEPARRQAISEGYRAVREALGEPGFAGRVADLAASLISPRR